ncbi:GrpB family protein [Streptomyces sp. MH60]|uniref:GrpB family protein n=1 Tax=Streptomyces sp. MH60 TaxID=1940758 RepID=UPI000D483968|nr:GrpB family protein [Streptomyces sp. MH60]PPS91421.1 Dephospho-CoA kinase [Streptomyces sp. MH60]
MTELVGGVEKRELYLVPHDAAWAGRYASHEARIRNALGDTALAVEHIGSTAVPGLAAKPIIDIVVAVRDITAEEEYLDPLLACGYVLRVREPGHRLLRTESRDLHLHLLEDADPAIDDYLLLRDHLRANETDRQLYESTKRDLMTREWADMNAYADAKTGVIEEIKARARSRRVAHRDSSRPLPFLVHGQPLDVEADGQASGSTSGCVNRTGLPSDRA